MPLTDQAANIEAIERYIGEQEPPRTPEAARIRDEFLRFTSSLSAWSRNFEQGAYDRVRNYKLAYNRANAITPAEKAAVEAQAKTGLSTEQLQGAPDRRLTDGSYAPPPTTAERLLVPLLVGGGVLLGLLLLTRSR